jgi:hypothetical protein
MLFNTKRSLFQIMIEINNRKYVQQLTTLHPTAGWLLKLSRVSSGQSLGGRPDATGSDVGGPVGGTLSSHQQKIYNIISQFPGDVIGDITLCRVLSFRWDVKRVSCISVVIKDPMALIVRVGVLTLVSWLNSLSHLIIPRLQLAHLSTIPQVITVNENLFSVNLPG